MDHERLTAVHCGLGRPEWLGIRRGSYEVTLDTGRAEIELNDAVMIRHVGRLLQRVVDQNRHALEVLTDSVEPHSLLDAAWLMLEPVRELGYLDCQYSMPLPDGQRVTYHLTEQDSELLRRYDALLEHVATEAA